LVSSDPKPKDFYQVKEEIAAHQQRKVKPRELNKDLPLKKDDVIEMI